MKRHKIHIDTLFIDEALFIHALIKISICAKFDIGIFSVDKVEGIFFRRFICLNQIDIFRF